MFLHTHHWNLGEKRAEKTLKIYWQKLLKFGKRHKGTDSGASENHKTASKKCHTESDCRQPETNPPPQSEKNTALGLEE